MTVDRTDSEHLPPDAAMASADPGRSGLVPAWLINLAELGWRVLVIAALVLVLWFIVTTLSTVSASIAVAVVVAALFAPSVLRLRAGGRSRDAAAGIVWATAILSIGAVLVLLTLAFLPYLADVARLVQEGATEVASQLSAADMPASVTNMVDQVVNELEAQGDSIVSSIVSSAATIVTVLLLATFLLFFFLRDGDKAWVWTFQAIGEQKRERITAAGDDALARVGGYLRGTIVLSGLIAITNYAFMWLLGVPLALPLAILSFLAGFIPYFGGIVVTAIILLVTWAALGPWPVVVMVVLIGIRNLILGYGVRPLVYGRTVNIHPALVLVALPAGFELAGVIGLFAAVPVTAVILAVASATVAIVDPDPRPELPGLVPAWLDRVAQWGWRILIVVALIAILAEVLLVMPLLVIPVTVGVILAATASPLVQWLVRRGYSLGRAAAIAIGGGTLVVLAVLALAFVSLVDQVPEIRDATTSGADSASDAAGGSLDLGADAVQTLGDAGGQAIIALGQSVATVAIVLLLSTLLAFYFLRDGGRAWMRTLDHVRPDAASELGAAGKRAFDVLGGYMIGTAAISFVGAASQFVIMVLLGLPLALPIFVLSFILCFIPYIGGFISTGAAFLIAIAAGSPMDVLVMGIWTVVFNIVQGNVVSPIVYGRTVHIHPAIVLVGIPAAAGVAGILGMFIVVPAMGVVAATWRTVLGVMGSGDEPVATSRSTEPASDASNVGRGAPPATADIGA
jgi:predicted PurR-regulated permease PerM